MSLQFEWDDRKARSNLQTHKVSFEEAQTVFDDPYLVTFPDDTHSDDEPRYMSIGRSIRGRILLIIHTDREEAIRIISSRKATAKERGVYEHGS